MFSSIILLCAALLVTRCTTAVNPELDTAEYFRLMKLYLGEDTFASHKCLKHQEENGWDSKAPLPMVPFTLGVEGTGHHAIEVSLTVATRNTCRGWTTPSPHYCFSMAFVALQVLLGGPSKKERLFTTVHGDGGQDSVPTGWRVAHATTKPKSHPDIAKMVKSNKLIIVLLRYPPSSLLSSINRFQNRSEMGHQKRITGKSVHIN